MQQGVLKFSLTVTRENKPVWDDPHLLGSPIGFGMRDLPLFESMHGQSVPGTERGITGLSENFGRQDGIEEPSLINCPFLWHTCKRQAVAFVDGMERELCCKIDGTTQDRLTVWR